jgi:hypothetical protein
MTVDLRKLKDNEEKKEFKKFDGGKPDLSFTEPILEQLYAEASTVGANKYGRGNYINFTLNDVLRFYAALRRHIGGYRIDGEDHGFLYEERDPVDGQKHLASAAIQALGRWKTSGRLTRILFSDHALMEPCSCKAMLHMPRAGNC